jgi:U4/U6 small nuclear ribonucleoprotein PRP31
VTLAARVDSFHESTDGHIGIEYKEDIEKKIDKVRISKFRLA